MPITLDALVNKSIPLAVQWAGEVVNLHYRPYCEVIDDERDAAEKAAEEERKAAGIEQPKKEKESALHQNLADLVIDWDITEAGKKFPIDVREMHRLPHPLLVKIRSEIWADMYPNLTRGGNTAAG